MRFSVIVPIYNVARFIDAGLAQLAAQTFDGEWEVILIDDGSVDGSSELIDLAARSDRRVRAFHQENNGAGPARNKGIEEAGGEYIWFYDIDDEVEPGLLARLDAYLKLHGDPQLAVFGFDETDVVSRCCEPRLFPQMVVRSNEELRDIWVQYLSGASGGNNGFVWNKIYRRDFLNDNCLRFGTERIQQDEVFNLKVYGRVQTAVLLNDCLYHYKVYDYGNTRSHFIADRMDIYSSVIKAFRHLMSVWGIVSAEVDKWLALRFLGNVIQTLTFNCYHSDAGWSKIERRRQMAMIMAREDVRRLPAELRRLDVWPTTFPMSSYAVAIERQSVRGIESVRRRAEVIRSLRRFVRKIVCR